MGTAPTVRIAPGCGAATKVCPVALRPRESSRFVSRPLKHLEAAFQLVSILLSFGKGLPRFITRQILSHRTFPMNATAPIPKCCCCRATFQPDARNRYHQKFCSRPRCRRASKRASQRRWVNKAENRAYFCGPENVRRVQEWRKAHPDYSRKPRSASAGALQENCASKSAGKTQGGLDSPPVHASALQEVCRQELPLLVGLIARIQPCALQKAWQSTSRRW